MSYLQHFGLKNAPFHKATTELWYNEDLKALESKFKILLKTPGIGVLTGGYGFGKTASLRNILSKINQNNYSFTYTPDSNYGRNEFYRIIAKALGVELSHKRSDLWSNIREYLARERFDKKILPVLIIDEAHHLKKEFLTDLVSFLNYNYDSQDLMTLWFVGSKELLNIIRAPHNEALRSRIRVWHDIQPIQDFEVFKQFIRHGFKIEGMPKVPISDNGLKIIMSSSQAAPRRVNTIITNALEMAYQRKE
ncbi:AAA family ATPase, partial [Francisellaceae bacterium]|nr:AAA family ATPase [Francisellaceae bacterium]